MMTFTVFTDFHKAYVNLKNHGVFSFFLFRKPAPER